MTGECASMQITPAIVNAETWLAIAGGACGIFGIEPQGEGVAWLDQRHLVTSSENNFGMLGGLGLVRCAGM